MTEDQITNIVEKARKGAAVENCQHEVKDRVLLFEKKIFCMNCLTVINIEKEQR